MVRFDFLPLNQDSPIFRIAGAQYEWIGSRPGRALLTKQWVLATHYLGSMRKDLSQNVK